MALNAFGCHRTYLPSSRCTNHVTGFSRRITPKVFAPARVDSRLQAKQGRSLVSGSLDRARTFRAENRLRHRLLLRESNRRHQANTRSGGYRRRRLSPRTECAPRRLNSGRRRWRVRFAVRRDHAEAILVIGQHVGVEGDRGLVSRGFQCFPLHLSAPRK